MRERVTFDPQTRKQLCLRVRGLRAEGKTYLEIADTFNSEGLRTAGGHTWKSGALHSIEHSRLRKRRRGTVEKSETPIRKAPALEISSKFLLQNFINDPRLTEATAMKMVKVYLEDNQERIK